MRFYQAFPDKSQWTANSVQQYINEAVRQCKASTISELKRQLAVADPKLTDDFLGTVKKHYEMFEHSPEMKLEKLAMLATCAMEPHAKVKWLNRWNSSPKMRELLKFPPPGFSDDAFKAWLPKAVWWSQVSLILSVLL